MTDIANLGFRVDSATAVKATSDLDRLGDQATVTERQFSRASRNITGGFAGMGRQANRSSRAFSGLAGPLRQTSLQLSQVAQQGQVTGNYLDAFAIQAADIGMFFGVAGTAAGVLAGALIPLASNLINVGYSADDTADRVEELEEAVDRLSDAAHRASRAGSDDLRKSFGALTVQVRELAKAERELALVQATRQLQEAQEALASFTDISLMDSLRGYTGNAAGEIRKIQEEFDLTRQSAEALKFAFDDIANASGPRELSSAYATVRDLLVEAVGGWQNLTDEQVEFIAGLNDAQAASERMVDAMNDGSDAAVYLSEVIDGISLNHIISQADTLIAKFAVAAQNAYAMMQNAAEANLRAQMVGRGRGMSSGPTAEEIQRNVPAAQLAYQPGGTAGVPLPRTPGVAGRSSRSSGGRSGGADPRKQEAAKIMREVERATLDAMTATERYNREAQELKELHEEGYLSANEYQRAMDMIGTELEDAQFENMRRGIESISDAIAQAIVNGEDLGETFGNIVKQMAADLISSGISDMIGNLFKGSSGGGGFFGKLFAGLFDSGGHIPRGQFGIVGERGPEIVTGPAQVTSRAQTARIMGGGQVGGSATLHIVAPEGFSVQQQGQIQNIAIQVASEGINQYDRQTLPGSVARISRDQRRRG